MRRTTTGLALGALVATTGLALAAGRPMTPEDILAIERISDPRPSPDGASIVFVVTAPDEKKTAYQSDLWLVRTEGGEPVRLTRSEKNDRAPAWSPDGRLLAFLSEREEEAQIYLLDPRGGEPWRLTEAEKGVTAFTWSPDGKAIAYLTADPPSEEEKKRREAKDDERVVDEDFELQHLWRIELASKETKRLTEGEYTLAEPEWSPDGTVIAAVRRPNPKADDRRWADIVLVPAEGGAPRVLYDNDGPDTTPRFSPDGRLVAFLSRHGSLHPNGNDRLYVIDLDGGEARALTDIDLEPREPVWSPDGGRLWFAAGRGVRGEIWSVGVEGGDARAEIEGSFVATAPRLAGDGTAVFLREDPTRPADVWVRPAGSDAVRRTSWNGWIEEIARVEPRVVRWTSADGLAVEGLLYTPAEGEGPWPLLVEVHGGPSGAYTLSFPGSWSRYAHVYVGRGWAVFQPNFRGSANYGDAFLRKNLEDWGRGDFADIMTGVDWLVEQGIADPDRLAIRGWSYGGYMTAWTITQTDRFRAASCGAGLTNLVSMYGTNDIPSVLRDYFGGPPWDDLEKYERASAIYHVTAAKTPTLILHGEKDERVPLGQSQELYAALRDRGVPVRLVVYPREPHGLREPAHQLDKMEREIDWLEKYALSAGPTTSAPQ